MSRPPGSLQRDAVRRAAADDEDVPAAHPVLAVAEPLRPDHPVDVQDVGAQLRCVRITQPQRRPHPRPERAIGVVPAELGELTRTDVREEHLPDAWQRIEPGAHFGGVPLPERQVQRHPVDDDTLRQQRLQLGHRHPMPTHRRSALEDDPGSRVPAPDPLDVVGVGNGVDDPGVEHVGGSTVQRVAVRLEDEHPAGEARQRLVGLVIGAHRDEVGRALRAVGFDQAPAFRQQHVAAEAVAVPLDDGHETRGLPHRRGLLGPPPRGVDVEHHRHLSAAGGRAGTRGRAGGSAAGPILRRTAPRRRRCPP